MSSALKLALYLATAATAWLLGAGAGIGIMTREQKRPDEDMQRAAREIAERFWNAALTILVLFATAAAGAVLGKLAIRLLFN